MARRPRTAPTDTGHDSTGRIDASPLEQPPAEIVGSARFYLCGPAGFLSEVGSSLRRRGVAEQRIAVESFTGG